MEYEALVTWYDELCQTMNYSKVATLAQSLYGVASLMLVTDKPEYEIVLNQLSRWWELFESFAELEDSVTIVCTLPWQREFLLISLFRS